MEYKRIEDLNIIECLERIQIKLAEAKSVITKSKSQADVTQSLSNISAEEASEIKALVVNRLTELLLKDKSAYLLCKNMADFQNYLSAWGDGLWRKEAETSIKRIEEAEKESNYYKSNKGSIAGLNKYLSSYPRGKYADSAKQLLNAKKRNRKITTFSISAIVTLIIAILCYTNYHSVSYLNAVDNVSFTKKGGTASRSISTDALGSNIQLAASADWIKINKSGRDFTIEVEPNHGSDKTGKITIYAYTTLFNFNLSRETTSIEVHQASGIATNLEVTESSLHFEKYSSDTHTIYATTDGMNMKVTTEGIDDDWIDVTHDISEDGDNYRAKIVVSSHNNEGGEKHGFVLISSDSFEKRISLSQESGLATFFNISPDNLLIREEGNGEGRYYQVKVETDGTTWSVKDQPSWLDTEINFVGKELKVTMGENNGRTRIGTISLLSNNGDLREIEVKQWGDPTNFSSSRSSLKFGTSSDYEYVSISNDSRKSLSVSDDKSWITATSRNSSEIRISCSDNNGSPRMGTVDVRCGGEHLSITVKQDGWESCSSCNGSGYVDCYGGWITMYGGRVHTQQRMTYNWDAWGNMYPYWVTDNCSVCGGDGRIECSRCHGKGKFKKSY